MVLCPAKTSGPVVNLIDLNEDEVEDHFKTICLFSHVPSVKLRGVGVEGALSRTGPILTQPRDYLLLLGLALLNFQTNQKAL